MKSPVELNSLLLTFSSYYISQTWYRKIENIKKMKKIIPSPSRLVGIIFFIFFIFSIFLYQAREMSLKMMRSKHFIDGRLGTGLHNFYVLLKQFYLTLASLKKHIYYAVIKKMFGSRHPPAPKLFFNFSRSFGAQGWAFFK